MWLCVSVLMQAWVAKWLSSLKINRTKQVQVLDEACSVSLLLMPLTMA